MIKLYDPNEQKKVETRIEVEQTDSGIDISVVDMEGNLISCVLKISKDGVLLYRSIDICFDHRNDIPFKLDSDGKGHIKVIRED